MVTISDIAKEAKVSVGTVSNVLNQKGNVSVKTIRTVEKAAQKLGYYGNPIAKSIRAKEPNVIAFILPEYTCEVNSFVNGMKGLLEQCNYELKLFFYRDSIDEIETIRKVAESNCLAVIALTSLRNYVEKYYKLLAIDTKNIIFFNGYDKEALSYARFQLKSSAIKIADLIADKNMICLISCPWDNERVEKIKEILEIINPECTYIHLCLEDRNYIMSIYSVLQGNFDCIISFSKNITCDVLDCLNFVDKELSVINLIGEKSLNHVSGSNVIFQNYYGLGLKIANKLVDNLKIKELNSLKIEEKDISLSLPSFEIFPQRKLKLLTIYNPTVSALEQLKSNFYFFTGIELEIITKSYVEFIEILNSEDYKKYDLIRIGMEMLPWFSEKIFISLADRDPYIDQLLDSFDDKMQNFFVKLNDQSLSLPFDPNIQMMFYRKDLFENQILQKLFFKQYKRNLTPPTNYEELIEVADFFSTCKDPENTVSNGISMAIQNTTLMAAEILTSYYSLGGEVTVSNGMLQLDTSLFIEGLNNYVKLFKHAKKEKAEWWNNSVESYLKGETAMIITYVNQLSFISQSEYAHKTGYTTVPGNHAMLGGGALGICRGSKYLKEALEFIRWMYQYKVAENVVYLDGLTAISDVFFEEGINKIFPWLTKIDEIRKEGIRLNRDQEKGAVNIPLFEKIVGEEVLKQLEFRHTSEVTVIKIMERVLMQRTELVRK